MRYFIILFLLSLIACEKLPTNETKDIKALVTGFFTPDTNYNALYISKLGDMSVSSEELLQTEVMINGENVNYQISNKPNPYEQMQDNIHLLLEYTFTPDEKYSIDLTGFNGIHSKTEFIMPGKIDIKASSENNGNHTHYFFNWDNVSAVEYYFIKGFFIDSQEPKINTLRQCIK